MCLHQNLTRRNFGKLAVGGLIGLSLAPIRCWAAGEAEALAITCIDYRLAGETGIFFDRLHLTKEYDQVSLAGASLAGVSPMFPSANAAFWDQLELAKQLHNVKKLIILDHRDCGAYKAAFGDKYAADKEPETEQHKSVMQSVKTKLAVKYPELGFEGYLMALDASVEKIV